MKISEDKKLVMVSRTHGTTGESWTEVIRLDAIKAIVEHRVGRQTYGSEPGRRRGYDVMLDGGQWGSFWINDTEYKEICKLLRF